ncbi:MAG: DNA-directed RNA polymerase subunit alpha [bacterium]|nr:DNA-directed RNA polymerase subunit alpha [bacterium]
MKWTGLKRPRKVEFDNENNTDTYGEYVIEPFEKGFGLTIGNAMRRVLLSSIEGSAVTSVKFENILHEYSTIPNVLEDTLQIIMNVKGLVLRLDGDRPKNISIEFEGEGEVTAKDIVADADVTILNPDHHLAMLAEDGRLKIDMEVRRGRGYVPVENIRDEDEPVGVIPIDAIFSPVRKVKYKVEDTRVGQQTDYDRLILKVWTDGSISPNDAVTSAAEILKEHVEIFIDFESAPEIETEIVDEERERLRDVMARSVNELELSVRAVNCLEIAEINTIADLVKKTDQEMLKYRNFGRKSLNEIKEVLEGMNLTLGMDLSWTEEEDENN